VNYYKYTNCSFVWNRKVDVHVQHD